MGVVTGIISLEGEEAKGLIGRAKALNIMIENFSEIDFVVETLRERVSEKKKIEKVKRRH